MVRLHGGSPWLGLRRCWAVLRGVALRRGPPTLSAAPSWRHANKLLTDRQQLLDSPYHLAEVQPPRSRPAPRPILDAANGLFAERAYDEVSVEDIASSAGVARGLVHHYFGGRKDVYIGLLERLGAQREEGLRAPVGRSARAARGGFRVALARLDRGQPHDLAGDDRARRRHRRPRRKAGGRRPRAPRRRAAHDVSRRHRRGLAAVALRARVLDRPQSRRDATLATWRGHPRSHARAARLDARAHPAHVRRSTGATPAHIASLRSQSSSSMRASGGAASRDCWFPWRLSHKRSDSVRVGEDDFGTPQNLLACDREQELLPPGLRERLPENHSAWCVIGAVAGGSRGARASDDARVVGVRVCDRPLLLAQRWHEPGLLRLGARWFRAGWQVAGT